MLKYKGDKKGLIEYTTRNRDYFSCVDYETSQAIKVLLGTGEFLKHTLDSKTKEGNDVCKALQDLYDDGITEGKRLGREEGIEEGSGCRDSKRVNTSLKMRDRICRAFFCNEPIL